MDFYSNFGEGAVQSTSKHIVGMNAPYSCRHRPFGQHIEEKPRLPLPPSLSLRPPLLSHQTDVDPCLKNQTFSQHNVPLAPYAKTPPQTFARRPATAYPEIRRPSAYFPSSFQQAACRHDRSQQQAPTRPSTSFRQRTNGFVVDQRDLPEELSALKSEKRHAATIPKELPTKGAIRISRVDAWTRFLTYEACFQLCLDGSMEGRSEAEYFTKDGCSLLKSALHVSEMLLNPGVMDCDASCAAAPFILWEEHSHRDRRSRMLELGLGDSHCRTRAASPVRKLVPKRHVDAKSMTHVQLERLTASPASTVVSGRWPLQRSLQKHAGMPTSVCIYGINTGHFCYTFIDGNGRPTAHTNGGVLSMEGDTDAWIKVDVYIDDYCIGAGTVSLKDLENGEILHLPPSSAKKENGRCFPRHNRPQDRPKSKLRSLFSTSKSRADLKPNKNRVCLYPWMETSERNRSVSLNDVQKTFNSQQDTRDVQRLDLRSQQSNRPYTSAGSPPSWRQVIRDIEIFDKENRPLDILCSLKIERSVQEQQIEYMELETSVSMPPVPKPEDLPDEKENPLKPSVGYIRVSGNMAYEYLFGCALRHEDCGSIKLSLEGPWQWLLSRFAQCYGIRSAFNSLTQLRWILRPDVKTCTTHCLSFLQQKFAQLLQERSATGLQEQELSALRLICREIKDLLALVFENYYLLSDACEFGIHEGPSGAAQHSCPPPALLPALCLLDALNTTDIGGDPGWLADRFKTAAVRKYSRLQCSIEEDDGVSEATRLQTYKGMESLTHALRQELEYDARLQDCGILPPSVNLPLLTSEVFCKYLSNKLERILDMMPPKQPSQESIDMLVGLSKLQEYLRAHDLQVCLEPPAVALDIFYLFEPFVSEWFHALQVSLTAQCRQLHGRLPECHETNRYSQCSISPLVSEMLALMKCEMNAFERVIRFWNIFGTQLESVMCHMLRIIMTSVSTQCGVAQTAKTMTASTQPLEHGAHCGGRRSSHGIIHNRKSSYTPTRQQTQEWEHSPRTYPRCYRGIDSGEATLLNSLRLMLGAVPELEHTLMEWCHSASTENGVVGKQQDQPEIGDQFAQVVKELRTEYSNVTVRCCHQMVQEITKHPQNMIGNILHQTSQSPSCQSMEERMDPLLATLTSFCGDLEKIVDTRVFVTLLRGLWEHLSDDLYIFVENLQEGHDHHEAWKSRQNAKSVAQTLNEWFQGSLTTIVGHDLNEKDLELPLHASMTQKLLADNSSIINMSYAVF